jgi:hypothetical protein
MRQRSASRARPWSLWAALALLLFLAVGALPAAILLVAQPHGNPMGMPYAMIAATPFAQMGGWLIPGIILFVVIGLGSLFTAWSLFALPEWPWLQRLNPVRSRHWAWTLLLLLGVAVMIWILVQVTMIPWSALQPTIFATGLLLAAVAATTSLRRWCAVR